MDRIREAFRTGHKLLIPFIVAGDPDYERSLQIASAILDAGADMLEIGFPYSDPLADGPVIQAAAVRSLKKGTRLVDCLRLVHDVRAQSPKPLVAFTYVNPLIQYGAERFFSELAAAGGDGVIVPDVPLEEAGEVAAAAEAHGIQFIPLVAPTSGEERVSAIVRAARGFVYCVSSLGVTGERQQVSRQVRGLVRLVRKHTDLPACVGFGVSRPEHVREIAEFADGVIVGSAYVRRIGDALEEQRDPVQAVRSFTEQLKQAAMESTLPR
ncbi:tryptophan synthase subunit alpha [Alicyclobacillus acidocaldarius]|uniref:Tryptophan synthase alpha chain n=1 Tax=Alicyclobacillus acidocaldarius (strain Tc-4-1) TaxID=1048834 RepID=F8IJY2_ALIAT|nr:tryptophan synthase subunit alpha [Alicyclobacillus acidocaldarius]AEJ43494.1 tryptophan synthase, alpha subunit [Alicyclobacillus acidocaldarius subsp. acidocaldarius Tc-4-1]